MKSNKFTLLVNWRNLVGTLEESMNIQLSIRMRTILKEFLIQKWIEVNEKDITRISCIRKIRATTNKFNEEKSSEVTDVGDNLNICTHQDIEIRPLESNDLYKEIRNEGIEVKEELELVCRKLDLFQNKLNELKSTGGVPNIKIGNGNYSNYS
jgi:hypothetical protein